MSNNIMYRHPKNSRAINKSETNEMSNSVAMLMIYHGITDTTARSTCIKDTSNLFKLVYPK